MKNAMKVIIMTILMGSTVMTFAQSESESTNENAGKIFMVTTYSDAEFIGKILEKDENRVLILTNENEKIAIPRHEVKELKEIQNDDLSPNGIYIPEETFNTRYVLTTNAISMPKGESYMIWNLYGPDFQFAISDRVSIGIMTTWFGLPIIGTLKYATPVGENFHLGGGVLLGSASWAAPELFMVIPFGVATVGNRRANFTISAGYGLIGYTAASEDQNNTQESALFSFSGMTKINKRMSFIFDSFIVPGNGQEKIGLAIIAPALRIQSDSKKAFQIGFTGIATENSTTPFPFPMLQWFRKF